MTLENLRPAPGATRPNQRVGRGEGSKKGGTSGRGHKGDQSRSGYRRNYSYEGGQMPVNRRIPKFGFNNPFKTTYQVVNLDRLNQWAIKYQLDEVTPDKLYQLGLVRNNVMIKILGRGRLEKPLKVSAHAFSRKAQQLIEAAGGSITKADE